MDKYLLLCALAIASVGAVKDFRGHRIPNWLTYSGLLVALLVRLGLGGWTELRGGLLGMLFAGGIFFLLFLLGGMGGGDVKLMAAVGAWVGLAHVGILLIMSAIAGGLLAVGYVLVHKRMFESLRNVMELVRHHLTEGLAPHPTLNVQQAGTLRLPYGLAIAIGTFYCVGNAFWWR
ncbi:MAG TPA: prepilin peptidase [Terriglobales bacterium]|nr:prepilin peptidase [Terriglobales bacterium]